VSTMSRSVAHSPGLFLILYQVLGCICPGLYRMIQVCCDICPGDYKYNVQVCCKLSRAVVVSCPGACEYNVQVCIEGSKVLEFECVRVNLQHILECHVICFQ